MQNWIKYKFFYYHTFLITNYFVAYTDTAVTWYLFFQNELSTIFHWLVLMFSLKTFIDDYLFSRTGSNLLHFKRADTGIITDGVWPVCRAKYFLISNWACHHFSQWELNLASGTCSSRLISSIFYMKTNLRYKKMGITTWQRCSKCGWSESAN